MDIDLGLVSFLSAKQSKYKTISFMHWWYIVLLMVPMLAGSRMRLTRDTLNLIYILSIK